MVDHHFASFVDHNGYLIELDGRRESPVNLGKIEVGLLEVSKWLARAVAADGLLNRMAGRRRKGQGMDRNLQFNRVQRRHLVADTRRVILVC